MYSVNMPTMDSVARFKAAMDSDKGALGPFMIGTDPAFVEAAGYAGYDFVLLDMEHGTTTFQTLPNLPAMTSCCWIWSTAPPPSRPCPT